MDAKAESENRSVEDEFGVPNPDTSELGTCENQNTETQGSQLDPAALETITYINNTDLQEIELDAILRRALETHCSLKFLECVVEKGANLNSFDVDSGDSLLIMSVEKNRVDVVRFLLSKDVNTAWRNNKGYDALHTAVLLDRLELLKVLIASGASVESWNGERSPMHTAALHSHLDVLRLLIEEGGDLTREDATGETVIHLIRRYKLDKHLKASLKNRECERSVAIEEAIRGNDIVYLTNFIAKNGDVHTRGEHKQPGGRTGLHTAALTNNQEAARLLLYADANPNLQNDGGWTPVREAMYYKAYDVLNMLAKAGANFNAFTFDHKQEMKGTYLTHAVEEHCIELVDALIRYGADINGRDRNGCSALHVAVQNQLVDKVELLLQHGAKIEAQDPDGCTPLFYAIRMRNGDLVRILLEAGARTDKLKNFKRAVEIAKRIEDGQFLCALLTEKKAK